MSAGLWFFIGFLAGFAVCALLVWALSEQAYRDEMRKEDGE